MDALSISSSMDGRSARVIARTASAAASIDGNDATSVLAGGWRGDQPQGQLGDDAERALTAHEQFGQRQSGDVLQPRTAEAQGRAVGQDHLACRARSRS